MATLLGWILLLGGIGGLFWYRNKRHAAVEAAGKPGAPPVPSRNQFWGTLAAMAVGIWLVAAGAGATARLSQTHAWNFDKEEHWLNNKPAAIKVENGALHVHLESGAGAYAVAPVDWNADAFRAEFDIQVVSLNTPDAVIGVGLFDGSISNIEDRDHTGGSSIQASFGSDVRLRVSDTNLLSRSDSMSEREKPPIKLEPGKTYHAILGYNRRIDTATLELRDSGGAEVVKLFVEELKDFTPNVAYFGVSIKGYNKNKDADPKPTADAVLDNIRFLQP